MDREIIVKLTNLQNKLSSLQNRRTKLAEAQKRLEILTKEIAGIEDDIFGLLTSAEGASNIEELIKFVSENLA